MIELSRSLFDIYNPTLDEMREHAEELDKLLDVDVLKIEQELLRRAQALSPEGSHKTWGQALHHGNQTWVGLSHQTLQTPYLELKEMCDFLNPAPGTKVIDLGAGYGRMGIVLKLFYPEVHFLGHELVKERVDEGERILRKYGCDKAQLEVQDIANQEYSLPEAEFYFIYDYGTIAHLRKTLAQLEEVAKVKNFKLVARGKGIISLILYEHPWLSQVYDPIHREQYSIFSMSAQV